MKIDTDVLKASYQDYVRQKTPSSLKDCPSPKKIVRLLRSGTSDKEATNIIDHISRCSFCFSEFEFVLDVLRQEKDFIQEARKRLLNNETPRHRKECRQKILAWRLDWRTFVPRFSWRAALILASFIIVALFMAKSLFFRPSEKYRTGSLTGVKLVETAGGKVSRSALVFKWKKVNNSKYYILELFDQALAPVWNSDKITEESVALPKELINTLEANRPYFWMVTAFLTDGEKISSPLEKIMLKE